MIQLSTDTINKKSPYRLELSEEGTFVFTTNEGVIYEAGFIEDHMIAIDNCYQFFILPQAKANSTKDEKIQLTITAILEEFFKTGDVLLDYICDTKDGRQAARSKLFTIWYNQYPRHDEFTLRNISITVEKEAYFASAIIRNDNLHYREYIDAIDRFEAEMRDKLK